MYPAIWVLVNSRYNQVGNQEHPSRKDSFVLFAEFNTVFFTTGIECLLLNIWVVDCENTVPVCKIHSHIICCHAIFSPTGSDSPLKLWNTTHSDERLIELKNSHCEVLTRKPGKMGNMREQTKVKKTKTWSQHKEVAWDKLCTLRHGVLVGFKSFILYVCLSA